MKSTGQKSALKALMRDRFPRLTNALRLNFRYPDEVYGVCPEGLHKSIDIWKTIQSDYGYDLSARTMSCVDAEGSPIPWYTYPAIEYLSALDFKGKEVFEYGSGNSTMWWADRSGFVDSVEGKQDWMELVKSRAPDNTDIRFFSDEDAGAYAASIHERGKTFDVIVVDGIVKNYARRSCSQHAVDLLNPGGIIVLDNSDRLPSSCEFLTAAGFTEAAFNGLVSLNDVPGRTSVFFRDGIGFPMLPHRWTVGGAQESWERAEP